LLKCSLCVHFRMMSHSFINTRARKAPGHFTNTVLVVECLKLYNTPTQCYWASWVASSVPLGIIHSVFQPISYIVIRELEVKTYNSSSNFLESLASEINLHVSMKIRFYFVHNNGTKWPMELTALPTAVHHINTAHYICSLHLYYRNYVR